MKFFPEILLNKGRARPTSIIARIRAIATRTADSSINWIIIVCWSAPEAFFMPISLVLPDALAVERFIKLMQAISRTKIAISVKIKTTMTGPLLISNPNWECR